MNAVAVCSERIGTHAFWLRKRKSFLKNVEYEMFKCCEETRKTCIIDIVMQTDRSILIIRLLKSGSQSSE
ncbi:unnamed protein product [Sphenostylis stenocarpa]|uniref:Uncharacterized protein n=1 Tax=Sphenostylis stenocarpa TaxID=92480 RepID=A0AA86SHF0_9FABA|nr:unnamed protein product [Sphenostylis stenocarpa]